MPLALWHFVGEPVLTMPHHHNADDARAHENRCNLFWGLTHIEATEEGESKEGKRHSAVVSRDGGASDARRGEAR